MVRIREDGSKAPDYTNTHIKLNKQYTSIQSKIMVNQEDIEVLELSTNYLDDTDSVWLGIIVKEQKQLYRQLQVVQDNIKDIETYQG